MSLEAMRAVFKFSRARDTERLLLLTLADWADDHGYCFPSYRAIAAKSLLSPSTVKRTIARAVQTGELEKLPRGHETPAMREFIGRTGFQPTNLYRITAVDGARVEVGSTSPHFADDKVGSTGAMLPVEVGSPDAEGRVRNGGKVGSIATTPPYKPQEEPQEDPQDVQAVGCAHETPIDDDDDDDERDDDDDGTPHLASSVWGDVSPTEDADPNVGVVTKLAHKYLDAGIDRDGDLAAVLKAKCAELHIAIGAHGEVVHKAIDSARYQRQRRRA